MRNRWQMNRFGLFNFWYYEDQEFELEEGRLILRGANGSGKSVTMQSFLPLILDGDKRPHRLDPFGSRDRRIEYYLLGDPDSWNMDRTAYLWMEFYHPAKSLYKTIGIGLRARRGAQRVAFWGFLLDDGRRINKDFWLYDRAYYLEYNKKIPLSRQALEEKIGSGGQVVQEQVQYRDLVNKALFGYQSGEAFQDLLQLMIQLRSPKLSKDFKPSSIYEILTQALPPLKEEELRPLSEVMEEMDQIADRLEEIRFHRKVLSKLTSVYDKYNRCILLEHSRNLLEQSKLLEETQKEEKKLSRQLDLESEKLQALEQKKRGCEHRLTEIEAELKVLNQHEAVGKHQELIEKEQQWKENQKWLEIAKERLRKSIERWNDIEQQELENAQKRRKYREQQEESLLQLEELAGMIEFTTHHLYHRQWSRGVPDDDRWYESWRRDLAVHRESIEHALKTAREARDAEKVVLETEQQWGEVRRKRDLAEQERSRCEQRVEQEKEKLREELVQWRQALQVLSVTDEDLAKMLRALRELDWENRDFAVVRKPVQIVFEQMKQTLMEQIISLQQEYRQLEDMLEQLRKEKTSWEKMREPEPTRSEARKKARVARSLGYGAPLYEVCEFAPHLDEKQKARLEETLERAGILDAWIAPDGRFLTIAEDEEEVWIVPQPHSFGYTLADVLHPTPSPESGLDSEMIERVLRSFSLEEVNLSKNLESNTISPNGRFRIGPLIGQVAGKERAEWIGKETRRRTRLLEIERLEREIAELQERMQEKHREIASINNKEKILKNEWATFPSDQLLQEAISSWIQAHAKFEAICDNEQQIQERYKEKKAVWRDLQGKLAEQTSTWHRLKSEKDLNEAAQLCRQYEQLLSDLQMWWGREQELLQTAERLEAEKADKKEEVESNRMQLEEYKEKDRILFKEVETLKKLIEESGIKDLYARMQELNEEKEQRRKEERNYSKQIEILNREIGALEEKYLNQLEKLEQQQNQLQICLNNWHKEICRGLVREWNEKLVSGMDGKQAVHLSEEIVRSYENSFANRKRDSITSSLLETFHEVRNTLADYAFELQREEESGRYLVVSLRNRFQPHPPSVLLEELRQWEEEQRQLLTQKDRELFEEVILHSVGSAIRRKIQRAEQWVERMNRLMEERKNSSGFKLKLQWIPKAAQYENQLDAETLVRLLKRDANRLRPDEIEKMIQHFRSWIAYAKQEAQEERDSLRKRIYEILDYRNWFQFVLYYRKGGYKSFRELTDAQFNVLSGGEKATAMYIPLFVAMYSRYLDANPEAPRIICLDEAFAGVDDENISEQFSLLTEMDFDYMMTSQVLWGCYETVPKLAIYEIIRPENSSIISLLHYRWNGRVREYVPESEEELYFEQLGREEHELRESESVF